jgi:virginiamycin B lyase
MTDSLEQFLQDLSFEVPAGLIDRAKAASAVGEATVVADRAERAHRSQELARTIRADDRPSHRYGAPSFQWATGFIAALLAVAVVAGLLFAQAELSPHRAIPAAPRGSAPTINTQPVPPSTCATPKTETSRIGTITEYPVPTDPGYPADITFGRDGSLWFTAGLPRTSDSTVINVTASGCFTEFVVPRTAEGYPAGLFGGYTFGPDGNVWFTERWHVGGAGAIDVGHVHKMAMSGSFTEYAEYPIPTPNGDPGPITTGPDGNLWFIERSANKVVRLTTSGTFTEYTIPIASGTPQAITVGPDRNLWVAEMMSGAQASKLVRVTTSGRFTTFTLPTIGNVPQAIALGPDGNLWVIETSADAFGRIAKVTPSGLVTEYAFPHTDTYPTGITSGRDGNLWVTESATGSSTSGRVASVSTSGVITEYAIPDVSGAQPGIDGPVSPTAITAGPDGNIWFTAADLGGSPSYVAKLVAAAAAGA